MKAQGWVCILLAVLLLILLGVVYTQHRGINSNIVAVQTDISDLQRRVRDLETDQPGPGPIIIVTPTNSSSPYGQAVWSDETSPVSFGAPGEIHPDLVGPLWSMKAHIGGADRLVEKWTVTINSANYGTNEISAVKDGSSLKWMIGSNEVSTCDADPAGSNPCEGMLPAEFEGEWVEMSAWDTLGGASVSATKGEAQLDDGT